MASLRVLSFDPEGRPVAFDTWHDDLQLYLQSHTRDSVSLFDHVSSAAPAPPATTDVSTRSQWLSRDETARFAIRNHLPATECSHFGEHRTAQALYDAVVARYSSPATAAIGRLLLPYLFPELSAFATVADLVTHLRTSDARYRAAVPAEFLPTNQPPLFITLYFIVTRLPDSLRSVRDHFLTLDPTSLTVDLLEKHLLAAETSAVAVGVARGTLRSPFFEGCSPSPLSSSFASAATADVSVPEDVSAASTSTNRRNSKGKGGRGSGGGSGGGGGGSGSGSGGSGRGGRGSGGGGGGGTGSGGGGSGGGGGGSGGSGGSGGGGTSGGRSGPQRGGPGGGRGQQQQHRSKTQTPQQLYEWLVQRGAGEGSETCSYVIRTGARAGRTCGRSGVAIFDLDFDVIISAMYALSFSAEGDCYWCVPPDPGIAAAALGASASGTPPGTAPAEALHTFTLDSGASRCFFRDSTTLSPLPAPVPVRLADPSGGPVVASSSTVLPCLAVLSGSLLGLHLPSFSTNLVSTAALQDTMVTTTTPGGQRVSICTCTRTGRHLATFARWPGSSLYTLATEPPQVDASAQVSASGQVAASCSCCLLSHQTLLWHHRLGHPYLPRLRGMHSRLLVSGLPSSLPPLPPSPAPPCLPCVEGWQRAASHSSFPPTTAPLQTLHMDVWGPARVSGQGRERYLLLVVDDYTRYTTVFPLRSKGEVSAILIPWIRTACLQLRERFGQDLPVQRLHSERGVMKVARTSMIHAAAPHFLWSFAAARDAEMASWKSTGTYADEVPPRGVNIVDGMWIFRVKRPPGSPSASKARYVARGFSQRQRVDDFQTFFPTSKMNTLWVLLHVAAQRDYELHSLDFSTAFLQGSLHEEIWLRRPPGFTGSFPAGTQWSLRRPVYGLRQAPREWHDTLRTTLAALGFVPSTADSSLFLRTDTSLPPFYILVYVDDLIFATADTEALTLVKSELQKRHTCTDLGEMRSYLGLQITRDRARRTIILTQSHMVHQVLQRFGFQYSSPQLTPSSTSHSLSAPPSDESVEPSGPYPELVGCLMYLMTCTRPNLAYPLSLLARYVAPGRHRKVHWDAVKRVLRYLCSTSGMGVVLGGRGPVVLTGHADASLVDDSATQRSSQGYTFSLGSGLVSWRSTRSSSVLSSSCEAEIYVGAMAAQELRWLTYLLTDLGEQPRWPPVLYVDNKAMIALCQEHRLEHRTKHIALRYFLARELQ
ncbi:unnamed protein product [Closterium sp. NIES-54]